MLAVSSMSARTESSAPGGIPIVTGSYRAMVLATAANAACAGLADAFQVSRRVGHSIQVLPNGHMKGNSLMFPKCQHAALARLFCRIIKTVGASVQPAESRAQEEGRLLLQ